VVNFLAGPYRRLCTEDTSENKVYKVYVGMSTGNFSDNEIKN